MLVADLSSADRCPRVFQALSPGLAHPTGGGRSDSGYVVQQHVAEWDSPSAQTPQLLKPLAAGTHGLGPGADPGPFPEGLSIQDFLPTAGEAEQPVPTGVASVLEEALQTIGSDLPPSAPSEVVGTDPPGPQEYDFRTILRPAVVPLASPGSVQTVGGGLSDEGPQLWGDSVLSPENTGVPDRQVALPHPHLPGHKSPQEGRSQAMGQVLGHVSEGSIPTGGYVSGMAPSRPRWNIHGHVSDASIKVGENVWDVAPSRPRWNVHGHVSDASIKVGENVWDVASSRPRWNVHGHVSDASIKVGENVWDVAPSRPRWNIHGHVSESHIVLGALSGEGQPNAARPCKSPPDHVSQSGLSLGAQSPVWEHEPQLPAETASDGACAQVAGSGSGHARGPQAPLSAVAGSGDLGDGNPEEPGEWDPTAVLSVVASVGPRGVWAEEGQEVHSLGDLGGATAQ